jgi:hypothetical protein
VKPWGPQSICYPVLDENSKERFLKERPRSLNADMIPMQWYPILTLALGTQSHPYSMPMLSSNWCWFRYPIPNLPSNCIRGLAKRSQGLIGQFAAYLDLILAEANLGIGYSMPILPSNCIRGLAKKKPRSTKDKTNLDPICSQLGPDSSRCQP